MCPRLAEWFLFAPPPINHCAQPTVAQRQGFFPFICWLVVPKFKCAAFRIAVDRESSNQHGARAQQNPHHESPKSVSVSNFTLSHKNQQKKYFVLVALCRSSQHRIRSVWNHFGSSYHSIDCQLFLPLSHLHSRSLLCCRRCSPPGLRSNHRPNRC